MLKAIAMLATALVLSACAGPAGAPRGEPVRVGPAAAGWNAAAVDELITYVASQKSTGLIIIQDNKLIVLRTGQAAPDQDVNEKIWKIPNRAMPAG